MDPVLFIGGTGKISAACVKAAVNQGHQVWVLNRGVTGREIPAGVTRLVGAADSVGDQEALAGQHFASVINFTIKDPQALRYDLEFFPGRTDQYIFISSASAYQKPLSRLPITESTPLANAFWEYSRHKITCENALLDAYRNSGFPAVIVRPSHTYDRTAIPLSGGWTTVDRVRRGKPILVQGDGSSLWVMTHSDDFARAFVALIANPLVVGEAVHITSDEVLTWDQIYLAMAHAAGREPELVHVASDTLARLLPEWGPALLGDRTHSAAFDNSKIKSLAPGWSATIPFAVGARQIVQWYDEEDSRRAVDADLDAAIDDVIARVRSL